MKRWIYTVLLAMVAAGCGKDSGVQEANGAGAAYEAMEFRREALSVAIEVTGVVEPRNRLEIRPPISGRIDEVLVGEGQEVRKGEVIARMSSTERAMLLDAASSKGPDVYAKWEDAYKPTLLMAPLDGTIIARSGEPGQTVTASDTILVLSDRLIVTAQVDETDIGQIRTGQRAMVTLDAYSDVKATGRVRHVAYEAVTVNNVTIYEVEIELDAIPSCMKSGMTASVSFQVAEAEEALTLPLRAVFQEEGKSLVMVLEDGNKNPVRYRVITGLSGGERVEILAGLTGQEQVVAKSFALDEAKSGGSSPFMPSRRR